MRFKDRSDAGKQLAQKLLKYKPDNPLVLALPRGGVPVGYEVARVLETPLDTIIARKIGAPFNPEFGVGAIAPGDVIVFDYASIQSLGLETDDLDPIIEAEMKEMERRMMRYKSGEYNKDISSDVVIIVDDGLATGVTARAAIGSAKIILKPKKIIFAAPVCARNTADELRKIVDDVVCTGEVGSLMGISFWYKNFPQTSDEEVIEYLDTAKRYYEQNT